MKLFAALSPEELCCGTTTTARVDLHCSAASHPQTMIAGRKIHLPLRHDGGTMKLMGVD